MKGNEVTTKELGYKRTKIWLFASILVLLPLMTVTDGRGAKHTIASVLTLILCIIGAMKCYLRLYTHTSSKFP